MQIIIEFKTEHLRMLTRKEVCELLNVHRNTVAMLTKLGALHAIKNGKKYMYSQLELFRFQEDYQGMDLSNYKAIEEAVKMVEDNKKYL